MASDIPAFLEVGTPVSAKFKGAFCEASIKSVKKLVKFKVLYKDGTGSSIVCDNVIDGEFKLGSLVNIKQEDGEMKPATIQKMNDHSYYTVVFDDGDERTLKRTNVVVMGERHFLEHENLDNLPLTDPENFLSPVVLSSEKRRKRRRSAANLEEDDSDGDSKRSSEFLGKVVCIEQSDRKRSWFPALGVKYHGSHSESQVFVQSFKDGKRSLVNRDDIKEFTKSKDPLQSFLKGESRTDPVLKSAVDKAIAYKDMGELPKGWNILDTIDEKEESSDEDLPTALVMSAEDKQFQEMVYGFMSKQGNAITKSPLVNNQGVNLHKMYQLVAEHGGLEEVTNQQWRSMYKKLGLRNIHTTASYNMKTLYKKYLSPYEEHLKARLSPRNEGISKKNETKTKRKSGTAAALKEEDKLSTKSESDSEPDRRRSTRGTTRSLNNPEKTPEVTERKRRSNVATPPVDSSSSEPDKESSAFKNIKTETDIKLSEAEEVDIINSPQSSITSDGTTDNNTSIGEADDTELLNVKKFGKYKIGSKISVRYGNGKNQRTYTAKILEVDKDDLGEVVYYIHYNGWNHSVGHHPTVTKLAKNTLKSLPKHDEWVREDVVFDIVGTTSSKQRKNPNPPTSLSKITKDPPQRYKAKLEAPSSTASSTTRQNSTLASPYTRQTSTPANSAKQPLTPAIKQTSTPVTKEPSTPVTKQSSTPVTKQPSTPVTKQPSTPVTKQPSTPVTKQPSTPVTKQPSTPVTKQPSNPASSTKQIPSTPPILIKQTSIPANSTKENSTPASSTKQPSTTTKQTPTLSGLSKQTPSPPSSLNKQNLTPACSTKQTSATPESSTKQEDTVLTSPTLTFITATTTSSASSPTAPPDQVDSIAQTISKLPTNLSSVSTPQTTTPSTKATVAAYPPTPTPVRSSTIDSAEITTPLTSKPRKLPPSVPLTVKCSGRSHSTEKLPSPIKSPAIPPDALFLSEPTQHFKGAHHKHSHHRPKPVNDVLFIPDIKPSPVKPRLTRNSMQDTFLLNALEQSIGGQTTSIAQQPDAMVKSEPPVLNRRRSNRQNPSPKSGQQSGSDVSSKEDTTEIESKEYVGKSKGRDDLVVSTDPPLLSLRGGKDVTSKDEKVKKWIEDSNNVLSKVSKSMEEECDNNKDDPSPSATAIDNEKVTRKGRKSKYKRSAVEPTDNKKKKEESDSEPEVKSEEVADEEEEKEKKKVLNEAVDDDKTPVENNNLPTEKDRTSAETTAAADTLSAFCNIVENVQKLQSHPKMSSVESTTSTVDSTKSYCAASPTKDHHSTTGERKKKHISKRKRTQSASVEITGGEDPAMKSPREKKEKQMSPPLEYNSDFISDLGNVLSEKSSIDRIAIMQSRLNQMRKLYCKLRQEVASIDRRKRRKLRKQMEYRNKSS